MKFSDPNWGCTGRPKYVVVKVDFDADDINAAQAIADSKMHYINIHSPGGVKRSPEIIRNRIIAGKLADAAVFQLIQRAIRKYKLSSRYTVHEYDSDRTDGFQHPDPYDLTLETASGIEEIEVRSSFSYRLGKPNKIIQKMSIYGWYVSANKPAETPRDWYWQVMYHLRPQDLAREDNWPDVAVFENQLDVNEVAGYIVGGSSREALQHNGSIRSDQDGALYQAITPICGGMDAWEMISAMLDIPKP